MRRFLLLAMLLAPLAAATAGTRATYAMEDGRRLVIEVADTGEARVQEAGGADYGIQKPEGFYMVGVEDGATRVARIQDIAAAIDKVVPPLFGDVLTVDAGVAGSGSLKTVARGALSVAGIAGQVYAVTGLNANDPKEAEEFVVSADPRLAPVGRALESFMNAAMVPIAVVIGPGIAELIGQTREIFRLGAPLQAGNRFRLEKLETIDVPAARVALPGKPQTIAEIQAALVAALPKTR